MQLNIQLIENSPVPLYQQLSTAVLNALEAGSLAPGQLVPSTYTLCRQYDVSRATAVRCYEQLKQQGILVAARGGRTRINPAWSHSCHQSMDFAPCEPDPESDADSNAQPDEPWQAPGFDSAKFPHRLWQRLQARTMVSHTVQTKLDTETDSFGYVPLRKALAALLFRNRGIICDYRQLVVFQSRQQALACLADTLVEAGEVVALNTLGYETAERAYRAKGADIYKTHITDERSVMPMLSALKPASLLHLTPCNQLPFAIEFSDSARQQLVTWLHEHTAYLIEDESHGVFHCGKGQAPALFTQCSSHKSLYLASLAPLLSPLSELSFVVIPTALSDRIRQAMQGAYAQPTLLEHRVLAQFLDAGQYDLLFQRTRSEISKSRHSMITALLRCFGTSVRILGGVTSAFMPAHLRTALSPEEIQAAAQEAGLHAFHLEEMERAIEGSIWLIRYPNERLQVETMVDVFHKRVTQRATPEPNRVSIAPYNRAAAQLL